MPQYALSPKTKEELYSAWKEGHLSDEAAAETFSEEWENLQDLAEVEDIVVSDQDTVDKDIFF